MGSDFITNLTDHFCVLMSRFEVETTNTERILRGLNRINLSRENTLHFRGAVIIGVNGYDDVDIERFEVPEVRRYSKLLTEKFPYLSFFLNLDRPTLKVIAFCVCDAHSIGNGRMEINNLKMANFLQNHFTGLNALFHEYGLDKDYPNLNREIFEEVIRYIES